MGGGYVVLIACLLRTEVTALICLGGLAVFKLCSFASCLTRDERMQNRSRGQRAKLGSLGAHIELQTSEPADTSVCGEKALLTHLKLQGEVIYCQCQAFKIRTKRRTRGGEDTSEARICQ